MTKKEFMIQYVLNRALAIGTRPLSGRGVAEEAWITISSRTYKEILK